MALLALLRLLSWATCKTAYYFQKGEEMGWAGDEGEIHTCQSAHPGGHEEAGGGVGGVAQLRDQCPLEEHAVLLGPAAGQATCQEAAIVLRSIVDTKQD